MRRAPTEPEKRLWTILSRSQLYGFKFRRQAVIGTAIADFLCPQKGLVIEVDGDTHNDRQRDDWRDGRLAAFGYHTLRVTNAAVMQNIEGVRDSILAALNDLPDRFVKSCPQPEVGT